MADGFETALEEARRCLRNRRWQEAVTALRRASSLRPAEPEPHRLLGTAAAHLEEWEVSAQGFARAVELGAPSFEVWVGLADALTALQRAEIAERAYGAALSLSPDSAEAHVKIGLPLERLGRHEDAIEHYARALELCPDHPGAHAEKGRLLCELGRYAEAVPALQRAVELHEPTPLLYLRLGRAHAGAGQLELAASAYAQADRSAPNSPEPSRLLGDLSAARRRFHEAGAFYLEALAKPVGSTFEHYFGGLSNTRILEIVRVVEHIAAYRELSRLLAAEGRRDEAEFVSSCIADLEQRSATREPGARVERDLAARALDASARPTVAIPRRGPDGVPYRTDKITEAPECLAVYEELLSPLVAEPIVLLELGIYEGGSLSMWRDYFERGTIVGLDVNPVPVDDSTGRIRVYQGYQEDLKLLDRIAEETAPEGFDVVIDDASHRGDITRMTFDHLFFRHLRPGGVYVIEDWHTGYLPDWPDGSACVPQPDILEVTDAGISKRRLPSHDFGMVGFVKQLLDRWEAPRVSFHARAFARILIAANRVFVIKKRPL